MEPLELGSILHPDRQKPRGVKTHEVRSLILSQINKLECLPSQPEVSVVNVPG